MQDGFDPVALKSGGLGWGMFAFLDVANIFNATQPLLWMGWVGWLVCTSFTHTSAIQNHIAACLTTWTHGEAHTTYNLVTNKGVKKTDLHVMTWCADAPPSTQFDWDGLITSSISWNHTSDGGESDAATVKIVQRVRLPWQDLWGGVHQVSWQPSKIILSERCQATPKFALELWRGPWKISEAWHKTTHWKLSLQYKTWI